MNEIKSVLQFNNYIVNEIYFKSNEKFEQKEDTSTIIDFSIQPEIMKKDNDLLVKLKTEIFRNAEENNYPFEMRVILTGEFTTIGEKPENFISNAIAILYPYVRAIVSTYTSNINIPPLILPVINVNKMIEEHKNKK